jgi:hypothetical protein
MIADRAIAFIDLPDFGMLVQSGMIWAKSGKPPLVKPPLRQGDEIKRARKPLLFDVAGKPMVTQSLVDAAQAALDSR